jgi:hypothetical protein
MPRKPRRNSLFDFVVSLIAIATVMALAVRAQVNGADPLSAKSYALPALPGTEYPQRPAIAATRSNGLRSGPLAAAPVFGPLLAYDPGGSYPYGAAIADLNADGSLDVVVPNANSGTVGVLLGNGHGWFAAPLIYNSGAGGPASVAIGDVNGDGIPDIVVANNANSACGIGVLLGNGDGTFKPAVTYGSSAVCQAHSIVLADLNGDGKLDVAVAVYQNVAVLLGNGNGTFQPAVTYGWGGGSGTSWGPNSLAVADLNGDHKLDLVVATGNSNYPNGSGTVAVLLGKGDGTFQPAVDYDSGGGLDSYASTLALADLNGDGKPDIAVHNHNLSSLYATVGVLQGNGDGTFQPAVPYATGGLSWGSVVIGDVNADGKPDLVVANECVSSTCKTGNAGVLVGNGDGTFQAAVAYSIGGLSLGAAVADVNGDGKLDIVVTTPTQVSVLLTETGVLTKTVVTTSGSSTFVGQPVTFTATVTPNPPDGELMEFYDGITMLGSVKLASGVAAYTTSSLSAKTHTIKATYLGDTTFRLGSGTVQQIVLKNSTTTTLSSNLNPSNYGQAVTLTAGVTSAGPAPTGTVTFKNGSASLGNGTLNTSGVATLTTAKIPVGANTLTSTYNGDASNAKSVSAAITQTVSQASVTMGLTSTPNPSTFGKSVKFTASLTSNGGVPSGQTVTFSYNGATLGTANTNSIGVATFSTTALPRGSDVVTAAYAGSVDYGSASATVTQVVN